MNRKKENLYRKVNTKAINCRHNFGLNARHSRNTKNGMDKSMKQGIQRGLDYTPLFRFLLSKVGQNWDEVYAEAKSRLPNDEPIFWMVRQGVGTDINPYRLGAQKGLFQTENARFSTLVVDNDGKLRLENPALKNEDFTPSCPCCTHTFNGKPLNKKFAWPILNENNP
jgi:hypothetical protein